MKSKKPADLEDQQKQFCVYRYEFFKRSKAFTLVQALKSKLLLNSGVFFIEDLAEAARQQSDELLRYVELYLGYKTLGETSGVTARTGMSLDIDVIDNSKYTMKHDSCRFNKLYIPVFLYEAVDLDSNIEAIKARIISELQKYAPSDIGITEVLRKPDGSLKGGKFLPFGKWERCLNSYDKVEGGHTVTSISKRIENAGQAPGYYKDPSNAFNKISDEIKEAKRLIESAANGTFPD